MPRTPDPVTRRLTWAVFAVIILWLAGVLSAVLFGLINPTSPPRTAVERDIANFTAMIQSGQASSQTYAQYVDTLIRAGQFSRAQSVLDQLSQSTRQDRSYLFAEQAQLDLANRDYQGVVAAADKTMAEADKELKAFMAANVAASHKSYAGASMPESYSTAALAKATALIAIKDYAGALTAYDLYLKMHPTDSDILVARATAKAQLGDKKGAAADYRAALKYIPDYQPALDGLKQIGVAR